jgi:hypothetical protein
MSKVLNVDDMLEVATQDNVKSAAYYVARFETLATNLAREIAKHHGIKIHPLGATWEGAALAGLCASFQPRKGSKKPCPPSIDHADPGGDWK